MTQIRAFISDTSVRGVKMDEITRAIAVLDYEHAEIHSGSHYFISDVYDLSINQVFDIQFVTPNKSKWTHLTFDITCESETEIYIYEAVIFSVSGLALKPYNNNRNSANISENIIGYHINANLVDANADTDISAASIIEHGIIGSGRTGGIQSRSREIILKQYIPYCFRAIAKAAGYINFVMNWYEHTNKL